MPYDTQATAFPTPTEFYVVRGFFPALTHPGWGDLTDGFADQADAIDAIMDHGGDPVQVTLVNLDDGTARDVTEDLLNKIAADSEGYADEESEHDFQYREARLAGHFA